MKAFLRCFVLLVPPFSVHVAPFPICTHHLQCLSLPICEKPAKSPAYRNAISSYGLGFTVAINSLLLILVSQIYQNIDLNTYVSNPLITSDSMSDRYLYLYLTYILCVSYVNSELYWNWVRSIHLI